MAYTFASGTGSAAPTGAWAGSTWWRRRLPIAIAGLALQSGAPLGSIELTVAGLRSAHGLIQVCLTAAPAHFPDCAKDPAARRATVQAGVTVLRFADLPAGDYAIALFHDENGNGVLDTRFRVPVEGFGFSNNPRVYFGPPSFAAARFAVGDGRVAETVRVRYLF